MAFSIQRWWLRKRFNLEERSQFFDVLKSYLESGFSFVNALEKLEKRATKDKNFKGKIYKDILHSLSLGKTISESLAPWVAESELMLIEGGERNANLSDSFEEAVYLSESIGKIKTIISSSAFLPILAIFIAFGFSSYYVKSIIPPIIDLVSFDKWSGLSQTIYNIAAFIDENMFICFVIVVLFILISLWSLNKWSGRVRNKFFDRLPPWSLYKTFVQSSFLITIAALIRGNYTILNALIVIKESAPRYLSWYLDKMIANIQESKVSEGEALNVGLIDREIAGNLEDASDLANFKDVVYNLGRRNIEKTIVKVTKQSTVMNKVSLGIVVVYIAACLFVMIDVGMLIQEG